MEYSDAVNGMNRITIQFQIVENMFHVKHFKEVSP